MLIVHVYSFVVTMANVYTIIKRYHGDNELSVCGYYYVQCIIKTLVLHYLGCLLDLTEICIEVNTFDLAENQKGKLWSIHLTH